MSKTKQLPVKLIVGMIFSNLELFPQVERKLSQEFGPIDFESKIIPFVHTDHYKSEMGDNLKKKIISFKELILPENIARIKEFTNSLEREFFYSHSRCRQINLDPGYLEEGKLVLATTKNHQHRLYLGKGIYGEVTLRYNNRTFRSWEWTYPDYRTEGYISIFNHIRKLYVKDIEKLKNNHRDHRERI